MSAIHGRPPFSEPEQQALAMYKASCGPAEGVSDFIRDYRLKTVRENALFRAAMAPVERELDDRKARWVVAIARDFGVFEEASAANQMIDLSAEDAVVRMVLNLGTKTAEEAARAIDGVAGILREGNYHARNSYWHERAEVWIKTWKARFEKMATEHAALNEKEDA